MTTIESAATLSPADLRSLYEQMVLIRVFETESERQYKAAKIGGYCHLSSGQEAATVGVVHTMQPDGTDKRRIRATGLPSRSPDGRRIAFVDDEGILPMAPDGSDARHADAREEGEVGWPVSDEPRG